MSSIYLILPTALGSGVYSASNRKNYEKQKNKASTDCYKDSFTFLLLLPEVKDVGGCII
jgi:hypothetical protein